MNASTFGAETFDVAAGRHLDALHEGFLAGDWGAIVAVLARYRPGLSAQGVAEFVARVQAAAVGDEDEGAS